MEYILTSEQLDKIMKPYWDSKFEGAELNYFIGENDNWLGIGKSGADDFGIVEDDMLLGRPSDDTDDLWFFNGEGFGSNWDLFTIDIVTFKESMRRYANKKYGLKILKIM